MGREMNLGGVIVLGGVAWLYHTGRLAPLADWVADAMAGGQEGQGATQAPLPAPRQNPPSAPQISGGSGKMELEETLLRQHWGDVQPWARSNLLWVAAMMHVESRGNPRAVSGADARGLMQVIPGTFDQVVNMGYTKYGRDVSVLFQPGPAIYIGTAYLQWLSTKSASLDWIASAYNAGPDGQRDDGTWPAETRAYVPLVRARHNYLLEQKRA